MCLRALEAAEQYADGDLVERACIIASNDFDKRRRSRFPTYTSPDDEAWDALYCATHRRWASSFDEDFAGTRCDLVDTTVLEAVAAAGTGEAAVQAALLRDVIGSPFRAIAFDPRLRTPTVLALAQASYENRDLPVGTLDPDRLAILADALEEAGCTDIELLTHLRSPGAHVRGCWPVDLLLNKK
jgi:hypothetical protein